MSTVVTRTVSLHGWLSASADEIARLEPLLHEHIRLTRAEPGCLAFSVMPNAADPGRLDVSERFVDRAAFEAHQARTAASDWGAATRHLVRQYRIEEDA